MLKGIVAGDRVAYPIPEGPCCLDCEHCRRRVFQETDARAYQIASCTKFKRVASLVDCCEAFEGNYRWRKRNVNGDR